jgi:hypothetical protein
MPAWIPESGSVRFSPSETGRGQELEEAPGAGPAFGVGVEEALLVGLRRHETPVEPIAFRVLLENLVVG